MQSPTAPLWLLPRAESADPGCDSGGGNCAAKAAIVTAGLLQVDVAVGLQLRVAPPLTSTAPNGRRHTARDRRLL
jgi:hypothetical protein